MKLTPANSTVMVVGGTLDDHRFVQLTVSFPSKKHGGIPERASIFAALLDKKLRKGWNIK